MLCCLQREGRMMRSVWLRRFLLGAALSPLFGTMACAGDTDESIVMEAQPIQPEGATDMNEQVSAKGEESFPPGGPVSRSNGEISREDAVRSAEQAFQRYTSSALRNVQSERVSYESAASQRGGNMDGRVSPDRPVWFVTAEGDFTVPAPRGKTVPQGSRAYAVVDASSGAVFERGIF